MKQNLTEMQYEQLAKEKFCKTINEIPFVSDVEIISNGLQKEFGDFYAIVHFVDQESPMHFLVEVKSNGEKRFVNMFMKKADGYNKDACLVFMAPYISEESAGAMRDGKYSYMDLSGNCYILTRRIYLYVSGLANKFIVKKEKKNYLSKSSGAASTVIRTMLNAPQRQWQVVTLANESGKAIGTVSNVKSFLRDRDWIKESSIEFKLQNIKELLYAWAKDYHKKDARSYEFYSFESVSEMEQVISEWSISHDNGAVLGGFSAAARYAPTVRYKKIDVYVEPQFFDEFVKDLDLQSVTSGGNVVITIPHDGTPCMFAKMINGSLVTSPVQTVIDLLGNAGRGEVAADAIITKEYRENIDD
ncbi:MAG: hypothetical protein HDR03_16000 [Lachnospiraceae bacterium]|nr:hypothetical protein [Lachnospiraceae bacterium]